MGIDFFDIDTDNLTATKYFFQKNNLPSEYEKSQYLAKTWGTESVEFFLVNDGCDSFERWGRSLWLRCPPNTLTTRSLQFFFFFFFQSWKFGKIFQFFTKFPWICTFQNPILFHHQSPKIHRPPKKRHWFFMGEIILVLQAKNYMFYELLFIHREDTCRTWCAAYQMPS